MKPAASSLLLSRAVIALLACLSGTAGAQSGEVYTWTEGPVVVRGSDGVREHLLKQTFMDVYCLDMPDAGPIENVVHGTLKGGAISYYRLAYTNGLHGHVVTSTLPNGRTASDEYARQLQREQDNALAIRAATSGARYVVGTGTSTFGPTVEMRLLNVEGGNEDGPFPVTRPLLNVPDEPLYSLSVHRLFVHGGSRYEIAVLGVPAEGESRTALEARATQLADTMVDSLQTCTASMEAKAQPAR